ncbi:MAG: DUF4838 domain-containing protein [Lentisphaeria bacterium]|nr:DUF4838 domain-containing protein [Lentisphaeria bacterium]
MKKTFLLTILTGLALTAGAYDLKNPALTPVDFDKTPVHKDIRLIRNGQPQFAIIADMHSEYRKNRESSIAVAVKELQLTIRKSTGKEVEVFTSDFYAEALKKYAYVVVIGDNPVSRKYVDVKKLKQEGYKVVSFDKGIVIAGTDSSLDKNYNRHPLDRKGSIRGTLWGVYDFMERVLDVRYYMPGTGCLYPEIKDLTVKPLAYSDYPRLPGRNGVFFINCTMMPKKKNAYRNAGRVEDWKPYLGNDLSLEWANKMNNRWRMGQVNPPFGGHDPAEKRFGRAMAKQNKLNTVFYKSPNGNFYYAPHEIVGSYYDVLNLEFADVLVESLKKYYKSNGKDNDGWDWANNQYISFGVTDHRITVADIEIDPLVKKLNLITEADKRRDAPLANVYARFLQYLDKRLQKELPGKKLAVMAYYDIRQASIDPKWKLSKNVEVRYCEGGVPGLVHNEKEWKRISNSLKEWENATGNPVRSIWAYNHNTNTYARAILGEMMGLAIRKWGNLQERDQVFFDHGGFYDFWHHFYGKYVMYRYMWNPDFNGEAAIAEMFERLYGKKSATSLVKFFLLLKKSYMDLTANSESLDVLPSLAAVNQMEACLNQAEKDLPAGDATAKKHFALLKKLWPAAFNGTRNRHSFERSVHDVYQLTRKDKIVIDGKMDAAWKKAKTVKMICPLGSGKQFKSPADVRLAWDKKGIYGYLHMPYYPDVETKSLWLNDNIELFLSPGTKQQKYFHLVFDARNLQIEKQCTLAPIPQPYGAWQPNGYVLKRVIGKNSWTVEFFLPFSAMNLSAPKAYESWLMNLVHTKKTMPGEYSSSAMNLGRHHDLNNYSLIKFAGKE